MDFQKLINFVFFIYTSYLCTDFNLQKYHRHVTQQQMHHRKIGNQPSAFLFSLDCNFFEFKLLNQIKDEQQKIKEQIIQFVNGRLQCCGNGQDRVSISYFGIFFLIFIINQYLISKGMTTQKENYLSIEYERGKGLRLNWNFTDILGRDKYFRHLIVIADHQKEFISSFVETFYKKMKYGDIMSCIHLTKDKQVKHCNWIEKTHINKFKPEKYLREVSNNFLDDKSKKELMRHAAIETSQNHDFVVVDVLMSGADQTDFYRQIIEESRSNRNQFNYIVNLLGKNAQNRVSIYRGINTFTISAENMTEYIHFIHNYINSAVMPFAKVSIECLNGQVGLFNEYKWKNGDFNSIETTLYGPSSQFSSDLLLFYIQELNREIDIYLQITFKFQLFSLKSYETVKKMHLTYSYEKDGSLTMHQIKAPQYKIYKNIYLEEDPYESMTVVKIYQNVDNNSSSFELI